MEWKKGRGKLGVLHNLIGDWQANKASKLSDDPDKIPVKRSFRSVLGGKYIEAKTTWQTAKEPYEDLMLFGVNSEKELCFWSFTSDGKQSMGKLTEAEDLPTGAIAFVAEMPAGKGRQIYWPAEGEGWHWAVEAQNKSGWKRFVEHHYLPA